MSGRGPKPAMRKNRFLTVTSWACCMVCRLASRILMPLPVFAQHRDHSSMLTIYQHRIRALSPIYAVLAASFWAKPIPPNLAPVRTRAIWFLGRPATLLIRSKHVVAHLAGRRWRWLPAWCRWPADQIMAAVCAHRPAFAVLLAYAQAPGWLPLRIIRSACCHFQF